jgi:hypothetical protein
MMKFLSIHRIIYFKVRQFAYPHYVTAWRHVAVGTVFQLHGGSPHSSHRVSAFLDREFPDRWIGRGGYIPWPIRSQGLTSAWSFLLGFVWDSSSWRSEKCEWVAWELSLLQSAIPIKYFSVPDEKLNIVLICVVPLMVPCWDVLSA